MKRIQTIRQILTSNKIVKLKTGLLLFAISVLAALPASAGINLRTSHGPEGGYVQSAAISPDYRGDSTVFALTQESDVFDYTGLSDLIVSPTSLSFGAIRVETPSVPSMITILNAGTLDLHILGMTLSDTVNYSLNVNGGTNPCGNTTPTIAPDNSCTVTVTFRPTSTGELDGSLSISSDDPDTPAVNVSLTGRGTLPRCWCEVFPDATVIARGETLRFLAKVTNSSNGTWNFDYATKVTMPNGNQYPGSGYLLGPIRIRLTYHESKYKYISHFIPDNAPIGIYTYHVYLGVPRDIWDECTFDFEVTQ